MGLIKEYYHEAILLKDEVASITKRLKKRWKKKGGYENFGQKELSYLIGKYLEKENDFKVKEEMRNTLVDFDHWILDYTGEEL